MSLFFLEPFYKLEFGGSWVEELLAVQVFKPNCLYAPDRVE